MLQKCFINYLCIIRAAILQQLAKINPTLPRRDVSNHDIIRNPTESPAIIRLYLNISESHNFCSKLMF